MHKLRAFLPPIGLLMLILAFWELAVRVLHVPAYLLPPPSEIIRTSVENSRSLLRHGFVTLGEAALGFALANAVGTLLAVLLASSRTAERTIYPFAIGLKTTPIIAMAPLLVIWFGTGLTSKVIASALVCFFPILINSIRGFRRVDEDALDLFRSLAASPSRIFFSLRLPSALPYMFSALKISSSLSIVGAIVGEFVGAQQGLGYLILISSYHLEIPMMFAAALFAAVGGLLFFGIIALLERILIPWGEPIES